MYPPGYSGSYLSWAINISDRDLKTKTVLDPINKTSNTKYGGTGTSHLHVRQPSHLGYPELIRWIFKNKVDYNFIALVNSHNQTIEFEVFDILNRDPDGVVIIITDNNDDDVFAYGSLNCFLKWPIYFKAIQPFNAYWNMPNSIYNFDLTLQTIDPYETTKNTKTRNFIARYADQYFRVLNNLDLQRVKNRNKMRKEWFDVRHHAHPHEINLDWYWLPEADTVNKNVVQISTKDIIQNNFVDTFQHIVEKLDVIDNPDFSYIKEFHSEYINAQPNAQYFESITKWRNTGELDSYLTSHSAIEGFVLRDMLKQLRFDLNYQSQNAWLEYYENVRSENWPDCFCIENSDNLPLSIAAEAKQKYHYDYSRITLQQKKFCLYYEMQNLNDINSLFQSLIKH